jgi:hypothetical protein
MGVTHRENADTDLDHSGPTVIARSPCDEAIQLFLFAARWIASLALATTMSSLSLYENRIGARPRLDCFVARAPRNDRERTAGHPLQQRSLCQIWR